MRIRLIFSSGLRLCERFSSLPQTLTYQVYITEQIYIYNFLLILFMILKTLQCTKNNKKQNKLTYLKPKTKLIFANGEQFR